MTSALSRRLRFELGRSCRLNPRPSPPKRHVGTGPARRPPQLTRRLARARARRLARGRRLGHDLGVEEHPPCAAVLRSGERCRSVATDDSAFCAPHRELAAEHGEEAVRRGRYPRRRMSWQDQQLLAEILFVDEIAAVLRSDGEVMLRDRVAASARASGASCARCSPKLRPSVTYLRLPTG
jgi:hypothetical protein